MTGSDKRMQAVLAEHFDPKWGSPYWLERQSELAFDPLRDIQTVGDLWRFGPTSLERMATHPIEHFIPRRYHGDLRNFVLTESGGTSGPPKRTAYLQWEFEEAFVLPFVAAAQRVRFPHDVHWLFIGPTGPHIIGKAARACASALGSMEPFAVDFDPRWVRKLPAGTMAHTRYVEHVVQQAEAILLTQSIGVLFATPPVLTALGQRLPEAVRLRVQGVHVGGLPSTSDFLKSLESEWFPNAVVLGGYGNSLAGLCPQVGSSESGLPEYAQYGDRLIVDVASSDDGPRGQVVFHRLDVSCFLPNVYERDWAERVELDAATLAAGFGPVGLRDPRAAKVDQVEDQAALY